MATRSTRRAAARDRRERPRMFAIDVLLMRFLRSFGYGARGARGGQRITTRLASLRLDGLDGATAPTRTSF